MSALFDYITGKKTGREVELDASLEHMGGHLGVEMDDNEKLRAELAHIHKDRTAWANIELSEENDRLIADNEKLRAALKRCATKLERCAIAGGTDPEFAAEAVKEFRALEQ